MVESESSIFNSFILDITPSILNGFDLSVVIFRHVYKNNPGLTLLFSYLELYVGPILQFFNIFPFYLYPGTLTISTDSVLMKRAISRDELPKYFR